MKNDFKYPFGGTKREGDKIRENLNFWSSFSCFCFNIYVIGR